MPSPKALRLSDVPSLLERLGDVACCDCMVGMLPAYPMAKLLWAHMVPEVLTTAFTWRAPSSSWPPSKTMRGLFVLPCSSVL